MYKLIAMDLDETLYNDEHKICKRNLEAIKKARELGIKIVPCSGRSPKFLGNLYDDLDIDKNNEYSILANGGIIVENKSNQTISIHPIPFPIVEKLFHFARARELCVQIFIKDHVYFYYADEKEKALISGFGNNLTFKENDDLTDLKDKEIIKVLFEKEDMSYLKSLEPLLSSICDREITISYSSNRYLELNRYGISKGVGLNELADHLHIDRKETIGIGDSFNDLELIKTAQLGCACANAIDIIKANADYICEADNNAGAVGEVIEKFILSKGK